MSTLEQHAGARRAAGEPDDRPALRVRCFGLFSICGRRGWVRLPALKKGRDFIEYLVAHPTGIATREGLAEALWPTADGDPGHRLHLAASNARAALRTELGGFDAIQCIGNAYAWHADLTVDSDLARFLAFARHQTLDAARSGAALYVGEFLAGSESDWARAMRVRCTTLYLGMLEQLAQQAYSEHAYNSALSYAMEILGHGRAHESASRLVMRCYSAMGRRGSARRIRDARTFLSG